MNWRELLLNLGTPVVETLIAEEIGDVVVFQKEPGGFVVIESAGIFPKRAVYQSEREISEEFPSHKLVKVTDEIYYLLKEIPENFDEIVRVERLSERLRSIEKFESRITRHVYQLEGMDTIISSLLEPIPFDILLSMLIDSLSELFVSSAAFYELRKDEYFLVMNLGPKEFPEKFAAGELKDASKYSSLVDAGNFAKVDGWIIPIPEELVNRYVVFMRRDEPLTPEEKALINAITKLISKSREHLKSKEREMVMEKLVNQMRFVMESLGEFSVKSLSTHDEENLIKVTVDMIREMLQATWSALYEEEDGVMWLRAESKVKSVSIPPRLERKIDRIERNARFNGTNVWLAIPVRFGENRSFVILVGDPITEEFLNEEVKEIYINVISRMLKETFENMEFEAEIIERERRMRKLLDDIISMRDFARDLRKAMSPGEVYKLLGDFASSRIGVNGMRVNVGGMEMEIGELEGEKLVVDLGDMGKVGFYKRGGFNEGDRELLETLAEGAISTLRSQYLLVPDRKSLDMDEVILRYLREKASQHGMDEEKIRFYVLKGRHNVEDIGVGLVSDDRTIVATEKNLEDLKKMGYEVEEI